MHEEFTFGRSSAQADLVPWPGCQGQEEACKPQKRHGRERCSREGLLSLY